MEQDPWSNDFIETSQNKFDNLNFNSTIINNNNHNFLNNDSNVSLNLKLIQKDQEFQQDQKDQDFDNLHLNLNLNSSPNWSTLDLNQFNPTQDEKIIHQSDSSNLIHHQSDLNQNSAHSLNLDSNHLNLNHNDIDINIDNMDSFNLNSTSFSNPFISSSTNSIHSDWDNDNLNHIEDWNSNLSINHQTHSIPSSPQLNLQSLNLKDHQTTHDVWNQSNSLSRKSSIHSEKYQIEPSQSQKDHIQNHNFLPSNKAILPLDTTSQTINPISEIYTNSTPHKISQDSLHQTSTKSPNQVAFKNSPTSDAIQVVMSKTASVAANVLQSTNHFKKFFNNQSTTSSSSSSSSQPVNLTSNDSNQPVNLTSNDSNQPVNLTSNDFNQPVNLASNDFNQPVNLTSNDFNQPVNLTSNDFNEPINPTLNHPINLTSNKPINLTFKKPINLTVNDSTSSNLSTPQTSQNDNDDDIFGLFESGKLPQSEIKQETRSSFFGLWTSKSSPQTNPSSTPSTKKSNHQIISLDSSFDDTDLSSNHSSSSTVCHNLSPTCTETSQPPTSSRMSRFLERFSSRSINTSTITNLQTIDDHDLSPTEEQLNDDDIKFLASSKTIPDQPNLKNHHQSETQDSKLLNQFTLNSNSQNLQSNQELFGFLNESNPKHSNLSENRARKSFSIFKSSALLDSSNNLSTTPSSPLKSNSVNLNKSSSYQSPSLIDSLIPNNSCKLSPLSNTMHIPTPRRPSNPGLHEDDLDGLFSHFQCTNIKSPSLKSFIKVSNSQFNDSQTLLSPNHQRDPFQRNFQNLDLKSPNQSLNSKQVRMPSPRPILSQPDSLGKPSVMSTLHKIPILEPPPPPPPSSRLHSSTTLQNLSDSSHQSIPKPLNMTSNLTSISINKNLEILSSSSSTKPKTVNSQLKFIDYSHKNNPINTGNAQINHQNIGLSKQDLSFFDSLM